MSQNKGNRNENEGHNGTIWSDRIRRFYGVALALALFAIPFINGGIPSFGK